MKHVRFFGFTLLLAASSLVASACIIDKSKYEFDDDKFDELSSGGRKSSGGSAGSDNGSSGGEGGDTATGTGGTSAGGQGGETGSGGTGPQSCLTGDLECSGKQLEICTGTTWIPVGSPCPFVCAGDQCTGVCEPTARECVSEKDQRVCNDEGQWEVTTCDFACVADGCDGVCEPGHRQCGTPEGGLIPVEVCSASGAWKGTTTICQTSCEDGICTGGCNEGDTQCSTTEQGDPSVLTCPSDGADWGDATETPCVDQACVDGACVGECGPSDTTCSGTTFRTCSATGTWSDTACPFVCSATMGCLGVCMPGTEKCDDDIVLRCNALGAWEKYEVCEGETPLCIHLSETNKACGQCNPPQTGDPVNFCHMTSIVQCTEKGLLKSIKFCGDGGDLCFGGECFDPKLCPSSRIDGCFDAGTGWSCDSKGKPADSCRCDCSDGVSCAKGCLL